VARWAEFEAEAPELAARAKAFLDAHTHLTIATLRKDGSPRISGIEIVWRDGDLYVGSMWRAVKALDLIRDPRFALHSGSEDPADGWKGDAKVAGRAQELSEDEIGEVFPEHEGGPMHSFRLDVDEVVVVGLDEPREQMVVNSWHPGRGVTTIKR
jgi:hypothetical protein